jgi:hypothetical protein
MRFIVRSFGAVVVATSGLIAFSAAVAADVSFGYIPATPEQFLSQPEVPRYRAFLPARVDLSRYFPTPGEQGALNSCTGWAVGYAARSYYSLRQEGRDTAKAPNIPNPNYIYQSIRLPNDCASGAFLLASFRLLQTGSLAYDQFSLNACARPSAAQRSQANQFKIRDWLAVRPNQIDDIKGQIAKGNPVIIGMVVKKSLEDLRTNEIYRGKGDRVGFHALTMVGFDDQKQAFKVINSWGTKWANGGFGWIDYGVVRTDVHEAYIIRVESNSVDVAENTKTVEVKPPEPKVTPVDIVSPRIVVKPKPRPDKPEDIEAVDVVDRPVNDSDCSDIRWEDVGGKIRLTGYAPTESDIEIIERSNKNKPLDVKIDLRPWPQCEALKTLGPLLNRADSPKLVTKDGKSKYSAGDAIVFEVVAPKKPAFIYVSYVQADGEVVTLHQPGSELAPSTSLQKMVFGDGTSNSPKYRATAPFGRETIVVLAAESPLFEDQLPKRMTERQYLSALRKAILYKSDPSKDQRKVSAAFLGLETTQ